MVYAQNRHAPIAIVGIGCRFPGGINKLDDLWQLLIQKKDVIRKISHERWQWPLHLNLETDYKGLNYGGFFERIDEFDASFFKISPKEAKLMDPQQRMLLEMSWHCLEDAGLNPERLSGSNTGVYIGVSSTDYHNLLLKDQKETRGYLSTGSGHFALSNRISYFFNFKGPSIAIDTASSSSLVALCEAVDAIRNHRCEQALVGGINLICSFEQSLSYYDAGMLSPDAKCKSFDHLANGYVRGEGGGLIFLKPLAKAEADGDFIYGVIRGSAAHHGGKTSSLTVPSAPSQAALLASVYRGTDIEFNSVSYIETHGSGTPVGDPIEIEGLKLAYKALVSTKLPLDWRCGLGSIKTNLGHLEAASGITGLLKILLAFKHKQLPAMLHHTQLHPAINLADTPFFESIIAIDRLIY